MRSSCRIEPQETRRAHARPKSAGPARPPHTVAMVVGLLIVLQVVGLATLLSASSVLSLRTYGTPWHYFTRQLMWLAVGWVVFAGAVRVDYRSLRRAAPWLLGVTAAALVLVLIPGVGITASGSRRWLGVGQWRLQPSELTKLALVVFGARLLETRADKISDPRACRPLVLIMAVLAGLIMLQPDMGTTLVVIGIVVAQLFCGGVPGRSLRRLGVALVGAAVLTGMAAPYRRDRLLAFLHPGANPSSAGYQTLQGLFALASGGLTGIGVGASRAKWGLLPNAHTDFIFAIVGEETGMLGSILVVLLFLGLAFTGLHIAGRAPDDFGCLVAAGVTTWVLLQAVINVGAVIGLLPVTGVPLPFVSFGGTSVVVLMAAVGLLASVNRQSSRPGRPSAAQLPLHSVALDPSEQLPDRKRGHQRAQAGHLRGEQGPSTTATRSPRERGPRGPVDQRRVPHPGPGAGRPR